MQKSYYFQHDYNASNDAKILFLRQQLGMEGYGIYWFILEQLAQSGGLLPLKIVPVLAMQSQTQETKVKAVIEGYDLFSINRQHFFSARLNHHLLIRKHLSEKGKEGAISRWGNREAIGEAISDPNAKERKGKEKKENKESKGNDFEKTYRIEDCIRISLADDRWVNSNKTNEAELILFNEYLERQGEYEFNPAEYKKYFCKLKGKYPDMIKKEYSVEELRELARQQDEELLKQKQ
jgi:hypothetical protein